MMKNLICFLVAGVLLTSFGGVALAQQPTNGSATAQMVDKQGNAVGQATFTTDASGAVTIQVNLTRSGGSPTEHGIHFHQFGRCDAPDFLTAGEHFNPSNTKHGLQNPQGPHAGDLPNLVIGTDGGANYQTTTNFINLSQGDNSLLDADGTAIIVHSGRDDQVTDPAGNSGDRIACGVLVADQNTAAAAPQQQDTTATAPAQNTAPGNLPTTGGEPFPVLVWPVLGGLILLAGLWLRWKASASV